MWCVNPGSYVGTVVIISKEEKKCCVNPGSYVGTVVIISKEEKNVVWIQEAAFGLVIDISKEEKNVMCESRKLRWDCCYYQQGSEKVLCFAVML